MRKRTLSQLPIELSLYESIQRGNAPLENITAQCAPTWRRTSRAIGGMWTGTMKYETSRHKLLDQFLNGLTREVREGVSGVSTWEGFVGEMKLTWDGALFVRRWGTIANKVKAIYSRIGDNEFTNGGAESGAWTAYNSPSTLEVSSAWFSEGLQSCHMVSNSANDGATIQTGIAIIAGKAYDCRVSVRIVSGTWKLEVYRTDTDAALATTTEVTAGDHTMSCSVSDSNTYAGNIGVRLYETTGTGEIYADDAFFNEAPYRAETGWSEDLDSQTDFGVLEDVLLLAGQGDEDANDLVLRQRRERAWPRTVPPNEFYVRDVLGAENSMEMTILGHIFTTRNKYSTYTGTATRSTHVTNLIGACEFLTAGVIETNARNYFIDTQAPIRTWDILRDITLASDADGNRWVCGGWANRKFNYQAAATTPEYRYADGRLLNASQGEVKPWEARPGLMYLDDMPLGPGDLTGDVEDDPRVKFIEEVEFNCGDWLAGNSGLKFRYEVSHD